MMQSQSNNTCHKDKTEFVQVSKWQVSCSRYHWIRLYCSFALCPLLFQGMVFLLPYSTRINLQPKLHQSTLFQASEISTEVWTQPWLNTTTKASNFMAPSCNATAKQSVQFLPSKKITKMVILRIVKSVPGDSISVCRSTLLPACSALCRSRRPL